MFISIVTQLSESNKQRERWAKFLQMKKQHKTEVTKKQEKHIYLPQL